MKNTIIVAGAVIIIALGAYLLLQRSSEVVITTNETETPTTPPVTQEVKEKPAQPITQPVNEKETVLGSSVEERDITAYHFGKGGTELLFVGGIHGGYEWNSVLVAYELMDYLEANPNVIPESVRVTVIPVLNPDGLFKVAGIEGRFTKENIPASLEATIPGRFNANNVDLNRNFDCDWKSTGTWQSRAVSGGSAVFSEPESQALRDYVEEHTPSAVVVWYSAAGGVYSSSCNDGVSPETQALTKLYANASGYKAYEAFDSYEITGDMVNWLAKNGIPAISVLLTNHSDTEWDKNQKGIEALLNSYAD